MINDEIYGHVIQAVQLILVDIGEEHIRDSIEEQVQQKMWPYITHAVRDSFPDRQHPPTEKADRRSKMWNVTARFWKLRVDSGHDLIAEADPELLNGTGRIPELLQGFVAEMHADAGTADQVAAVAAFVHDTAKSKLMQMRNNLGRQGKAVLRIEYEVAGEQYLCTVDVTKP